MRIQHPDDDGPPRPSGWNEISFRGRAISRSRSSSCSPGSSADGGFDFARSAHCYAALLSLPYKRRRVSTIIIAERTVDARPKMLSRFADDEKGRPHSDRLIKQRFRSFGARGPPGNGVRPALAFKRNLVTANAGLAIIIL